MNINKLISHYFEGVPAPEIFTFDAESINAECNALIAELLKINDIELSVVQSFNYCLYEVLDNVLTHSGKKIRSFVITFFYGEATNSSISGG
jgi:hypothetical protein